MEGINLNFKIGTHDLHPDANFNFQLNRMVMYADGDLEEVKEAARKITDMRSWVKTFVDLGERALGEGRVAQAISYLRGAEFFMYEDIEEKHRLYDRATSLFYEHYSRFFEKGAIRTDRVPYEGKYLPVWITGPGERAGAILLHGGYDSCKEEFLRTVLYLGQRGYTVYLFEGPGQGEVLKKLGLPFTHRWERPVRAVLDHYRLDDVTIVGVSLGGMLAPRAAAFEPRIKRVVAWGVLPNFLDVVISTRPRVLQWLLRAGLRLGLRPAVDLGARQQMARDPLAEWGIKHGCYAFGVACPYEFLKAADRFQFLDVADRITQDFLLLGSTRDHFIPLAFYKREIDALTNVRSLTFRLFTERESAENHCNLGNIKLALDTILAWLDQVGSRD
ncbi:alpha/beta hydrolase family protein [Candidatus Solincola sp.]|jgi:pimeloyl-ACP methyl ester carboxylesterase|nr:alpha/beta fold hydrolase [Actinomycetota bacterium]